MQQMSLVFEPGLAIRSTSLRQHMGVRIYSYGLQGVANIVDCSVSHLGEKIAGGSSDGKKRCLSVDELEAYIAGTGDLSPIYYLIDKYMRDPAAQQQEALATLAEVAKTLPGLLSAAGLAPVMKQGRARGSR